MDILALEALGKPLWMWLAFLVLVLGLLAFDLGVLHRKCHEVGIRESLLLSAFYVGLGTAFAGWVWHLMGEQAALNYLTGFVVEKSLAMDNIFVIAMIFSYFGIPRIYQHRVLVYGILGVIVLRAVMIGAGAAAVSEFDWVLYLFGAFLVFTGLRMLFAGGHDYDVAGNPVVRLMRRHCRVTDRLSESRFFVRQPHETTGRVVVYATPLFVALVTVEFADVIFAVDSIPAVFAITTDTYIVYTSNIFAILGLRALYFLLSAMIHRFVYLKYALAIVLVFIGGKIFLADVPALEGVSPLWSLSITVAILSAGILVSLWSTRKAVPPVDRTAGASPARSDGHCD